MGLKQRVIILFLCMCIGMLAMQTDVLAKSVGYNKMPILGEAVATKEQCLRYLLSVNPKPRLSVSPKKLVDNYYEEAEAEGVRPDIAFAQALQETGFFRFGGLVKSGQNNYCGLGSTGMGSRGAWFKSSQIGVRAHIQHLLAYSTTRKPNYEIVDPRYKIVKTKEYYGRAIYWEDLNGRWAIPGRNYGQKILNIYNKILLQ